MEKRVINRGITLVVILALVITTLVMPILENDSVYAASKKVKVKFSANGGKLVKQTFKNSAGKKVNKVMKSKVVRTGKKYGTLSKATKTGYNLKGWYTDKSAGKRVKASSKVSIKRKHTLYARWTPKKYNVKFNVQGGKKLNSQKVKYNNAFGKLPIPKKPGNIFKGWFTDSKDGEQVTETTVFKSTKDVTLYARWENGLTYDNTGDLIGMKYDDVLKYVPDMSIVYKDTEYIDAVTPNGEELYFESDVEDGPKKLTHVFSITGQFFDIQDDMSFDNLSKMIKARSYSIHPDKNLIGYILTDDIWTRVEVKGTSAITPNMRVYYGLFDKEDLW